MKVQIEHTKQYNNEGYCILEKIIDSTQIDYLRNTLEEEFSKKNYPRTLELNNVANKEIVKVFIKAFTGPKVKNLINNFMKESNLSLSMLPFFQIQRNYQVDREKELGWHRDCGGELQYNYCKNILKKSNYFFSKVGIYLQDNNDFGGGIDLIPKTHTHIKKENFFLRKLQGLRLYVVSKLFFKLPWIYKTIQENFFMKFLKAKTMSTLKGDCVFFESRLVHRGSLINKNNLKSVKFVGLYHATVPKEKIKFSLYAHFGASEAIDSYMYSRLKIKGNANELKYWNEQIQLIKKYNFDLAQDMENIIFPINKKYKDYL
jgi:hypothetical protein